MKDSYKLQVIIIGSKLPMFARRGLHMNISAGGFRISGFYYIEGVQSLDATMRIIAGISRHQCQIMRHGRSGALFIDGVLMMWNAQFAPYLRRLFIEIQYIIPIMFND